MRRMPGILWIAVGAALWGTDTVFRRPLAGVLGSTQIVLYEHVILSLIVLPIVIHGRAYLGKISFSVWAALLGTAWIGSALATVLFTSALRYGSPTTAVLLQKTQPLFAVAMARVFLRERWPSHFPIVAAAGIFGAFLIAFAHGSSLNPHRSIELGAGFLAIGAAAGWATATICGRIASRELPFELLTALRILCALPALFVAAAIQNETALPLRGQIVSIAWLAFIPGLAALMFYYRGLRTTPASQATIGELAFPATAFLLNWFVLGDAVTPVQIAGFVIVWYAIFQLYRKVSG